MMSVPRKPIQGRPPKSALLQVPRWGCAARCPGGSWQRRLAAGASGRPRAAVVNKGARAAAARPRSQRGGAALALFELEEQQVVTGGGSRAAIYV